MFRTFASQSEALGFFSKAAENKYVSRGPFVLCKSVLRHTDGCNVLQLSGLNEALDELQTMLESSNLPKKIISAKFLRSVFLVP